MDVMTSFVSRSGRILAVVTVGVFGIALATTLTTFTTDGFVRGLAVFGFLTVAAYAAFWKPRLDVDENGVTVVNPFSTHRIEWGAIERIDTKWGLTFFVGGRGISVGPHPHPVDTQQPPLRATSAATCPSPPTSREPFAPATSSAPNPAEQQPSSVATGSIERPSRDRSAAPVRPD